MCNLFLLRNDKALRKQQKIQNKKFGKLSEVSCESVSHDPEKVICNFSSHKLTPVDTWRKLNVHKTFIRRPGRLLNVLCTFNLRPVSTRTKIEKQWLSDCPQDFCPKIYRRYVGDIFLTFNPHEQLKKFVVYMNTKHPNL